MTDRPNFEARLEARLRARAGLASRPFDSESIVRQVVALSARRRRFGGLVWNSATSRLAFALAILLLTISVLGVVGVIGSLLRQQPSPLWPISVSRPFSVNGLIAVSANPVDVLGGENGDIFIVREGISPQRIIGSDGDGVAQECPRFSPDGARLAYGEAQASGPVTTFRGDWPVGDRAVVVVGIDEQGNPSTPLMQVALPGTGHMICPEWSPDGQSLAFRVAAELWIANSASGETHVVPIENVTGQEENELEWSRDGSAIAVAEPGQIRIVRVDSAPTLIEVDGAAPRSIGWTAGDAHIVYVSTVPGDGIRSNVVHVVDVDGTTDAQLSPVQDPAPIVLLNFLAAAVSPDGTRVAYSQSWDVAPIGLVDVDGRHRVELSRADPPLVQGVPADFGGSALQWAPDGQRLLLSEIGGVISVDLDSGSNVIVYSTGEGVSGLNLEWSSSEVTWQPLAP